MCAITQKAIHVEVNVINTDSCGTCGRTDGGFAVLLGVTRRDMGTDAKYIADKTVNLRIFEDEMGRLNLSLKDIGGTVLPVPQFIPYADARNGRCLFCSGAAPAVQTNELYRLVADLLYAHGLHVKTGCFQIHMQIDLCNDESVTLLLDSQKLL